MHVLLVVHQQHINNGFAEYLQCQVMVSSKERIESGSTMFHDNVLFFVTKCHYTWHYFFELFKNLQIMLHRSLTSNS